MLANEIAILIKDAMSNFQSIRDNPISYVHERYPWLSESQLVVKANQVQERKEYAQAISLVAEQIAMEFEHRINQKKEEQ
jgi:hypothetical protein